MRYKFDFFGKLLSELKIEIARTLPKNDLAKLVESSKIHLKLFKPLLDVQKLLHHTVRGEHDAVQSMLKKDINLFFMKGRVTDCSGRTFENISAFEYTLWALDKYMWEKMLPCIPKTEKGKKILAELLFQYDEVNTNGVTYKLHGKPIREKHFDFKNTLIKELQIQLDLLETPEDDKNWDVIDKQWREGVGAAQKLLPMHVVHEYCSDEVFHPPLEFISQPKSSMQFHIGRSEKSENWFGIDSRLGINYAVYCGRPGLGGARSPSAPAFRIPWIGENLTAVKTLCEIRTKDFINLRSNLEQQTIIDALHRVYRK
ncbi:TPA: F-box protein [Legionella pneumophila]|uniref:hypothetical protein n=1 Tax=Legionella pneumophila TaxID=446 RepID=UPI000770A28C|nr:hypothetical protein [Legionella pneumophila]HAT9214229.1 F-box protein [Legionella pneumophila subsp. pneumophila]CZI42213.1 Uncharacterised protein [Legionella pneumophila]CZI63170.1 Uncharacterised protein [Legionella pneumophila]STX69069.1 SidC homolog [Legionella pneumophila]HAT9229717.1 F-box protein [Legionella pneumophila subsp. pneumophila]